MTRIEKIEAALRTALAPDALSVEDESHLHAGHAGAKTGLGHFAVTIVSARFRNANPLQRHRLVYDALGELMRTDIHALTLRAYTPEEFGS